MAKNENDIGMIAVVGVIAYFLLGEIGDIGKGIQDSVNPLAAVPGSVTNFFAATPAQQAAQMGYGIYDISKNIPGSLPWFETAFAEAGGNVLTGLAKAFGFEPGGPIR